MAAALEIPALPLIGRLTHRHSSIGLIITGCLAGVCFYVGIALVIGPIALLPLQLLNAWFFAAVSGVGLTLFQQMIPRPGLASGMLANARRVGAIVSLQLNCAEPVMETRPPSAMPESAIRSAFSKRP